MGAAVTTTRLVKESSKQVSSLPFKVQASPVFLGLLRLKYSCGERGHLAKCQDPLIDVLTITVCQSLSLTDLPSEGSGRLGHVCVNIGQVWAIGRLWNMNLWKTQKSNDGDP